MTGENQKIGAELLDIERAMAGALSGIDQCGNAELARPRAQLGHWIDRAERVRNMRHCEQLDFFGQPLIQTVQIEQTDVPGDRKENQLRPGAFGQQLPRDDVAVVFHLGEQDFVARLDIFRAPGRGHQIDAFGSAARENDFIRAARIDKCRRAGARRFEGSRECRDGRSHYRARNNGASSPARRAASASWPHCRNKSTAARGPADRGWENRRAGRTNQSLSSSVLEEQLR